MAGQEGTKYQVNFKTHKDGTLINVYADSIKELETQLTDISMVSALIKSTEEELFTNPQGASPARVTSSTTPTVATVAAQFAAPVSQSFDSGQPCKHGAMVFKSGTSTKGPWKGWMCPTPKGAPDKCDTVWIR